MRARTETEPRRGFSLVEVLVTLAVLLSMMVGLLTMLESASRVAKQESNVAGAQAASRSALFEVSRILRQARVGTLSYVNAIIPYLNNAGPGQTLTDLSGTVHTIRAGTDAIQARGVFYGEMDYFGPTDVACGGSACTGGSNAITITIQQRALQGIDNYPAGGKPAAANRSRGFYYVVATTVSQTVKVGANSYTVPLYYVGRVAPGSVTQTSSSVSFTLDATDPGARRLDATSDPAPVLQKPFSGGVVDDVIFYVDRGAPDADNLESFTHPYLAEAIRDPDSGNYDVQPVVAEVEDFQVAYGIDGADGSTRDRGVDPVRLSATPNGDEWVFDVAGESLPLQSDPTRVDAFMDGSIPSVPPNLAAGTPALKSILVSLVVKSADPDPNFNGPGAWGLKLLDSTALSVSAAVNRPYRRRAQTMAVALRNYL